MSPEVDVLARQIADAWAPVLLEGMCGHADPESWIELDPPRGLRAQQHADIELALRYLELRGLIERHPFSKTLVRVKTKTEQAH